MQYEDFEVKVGPHHHHERVVQVVRSPAGEAVAPFSQPFPGEKVETVLASLARAFDPKIRDLQAIEAGELRFTPDQVGVALYQSLLTGDVLSCFDQSLGEVRREQDRGLRLKLRFDLKDPVAARLARLPWELLSRPEEGPLALHRETPVVRYLEVQQPVRTLPLPRPLRVLVIRAEREETLDLESEWRELKAAWEDSSGVDVQIVPASLDAVREVVLRNPCHVLHYMGHGLFDQRCGGAVLPFTDDDGAACQVSGEQLARQLKGLNVQLVFLNACNTARTWNEAQQSPVSIASALVSSGLPAVLAMQQPISDRAAVVFCKSFYRRLAQGDPIDAAATEARLAVFQSDCSDEWSIPVLYMRVADGRIFQPAQDPPRAPGSTGPASGLGSSGQVACLDLPTRRHPWRLTAAVAAGALVVSIVVSLLMLVGTPGGARGTAGRTRGGEAMAARRLEASSALLVPGPLTEEETIDLGLFLDGPLDGPPDGPPDDGAVGVSPSSTRQHFCIPESWCCSVCTKGAACGDGCIRPGFACRQPPGCACNAWQVCGRDPRAGMSIDPSARPSASPRMQ